MSWKPDPTLLYNPLPDGYIRLLQLQGPCVVDVPEIPGVQDMAMQCSLVTVPLLDPADDSQRRPGASYTALSYVWGNTSEAFRHYVLCDGVIWPVTMSLFTALRQVNLDPDPRMRTLWVDAICINQSDDIEKGKQITLMGDIYIHASQVLIWLGAGIELRGQQHESFWKYASGKTLERPAEDAILQVGEFVLNHEWLRRAWTFQEIVLAKRPLLQLGPYRVSWDRLRETLPENPELKAIEDCRESGGYRSLLKLIQITWRRQAWDERDKIYSLLGVYRGSGRLHVDLKRSVPQVTADALALICSDLGHLVFPDLLDLERLSFHHLSAREYAVVKTAEDWSVNNLNIYTFQSDRDYGLSSGHSWIFDWSRRPWDLDSQLRLAHNRHVSALNFGNFNPNWIMDWKLKDANIIVAGALCGVFVSRMRRNEMLQTYMRTLKPVQAPCMSTLSMEDLYDWSNSKKTRTQDSRKMQFEQDFFSSNDFYQRYVQEHCTERSCTCHDRTPVEFVEAARELSSSFEKDISTPPDHPQSTDTTEDRQQSSQQTPYKREPFPRIYLAALFGAKSLVIVQPFWDSKEERCTFRIRTRLGEKHPWTKLFFSLADCVPFEIRARADLRNNHGDSISEFKLQQQNALGYEFLSMSFMPLHFEFQHTESEESMHPAHFNAEMRRMKRKRDGDFLRIGEVDI